MKPTMQETFEEMGKAWSALGKQLAIELKIYWMLDKMTEYLNERGK